MNKCFLLVCLLGIGFFHSVAQVGDFESNEDIGHPKISGSTAYDKVAQSYRLKGSGYNIWFARDEFHYAYKKLSGDFILTANFSFVGNGVDPHRKIGWMVRASLADDAAHCSGVLHGDGLTVLQWRNKKGAVMRDPEDERFATKKNYSVLQLERAGGIFTLRAAHFGEPLQVIGTTVMENIPDSVYAGLFICAHNEKETTEAQVWNVRIDQPVAPTYDPEKLGYIGCRLEILDVATGTRKVIHESKGRFEAPNWMPDGNKLLFNENGSLYKIPIDGGATEKLNTGKADRNNNDHGISFDGKMLAISSHRQGLPGWGSTVYVLPIGGGEPKLVTEKTPSYWHGWAPNGKEVAFVGMRDDKYYNIYTIPIGGGEEKALTNNQGWHYDGPEYSPDGKYIYYNGSESGTMQIWRMKPDGSGKEQLTFDEYNNWFPHLSPDGKWMVFISFPPTIDVSSHPSYKQVQLRLMPLASAGAPKTIAYLYGGQGTINVPSWSPDGTRIAFVSNSKKW